MYSCKLKKNAFTVVELVVVIGIFIIITSFSTISLLNSRQNVDTSSTLDLISSDLKNQQIKSMTSFNNNNHGIYFDDNSYTLFNGSLYNSEDENNYTVQLSKSLIIETNLNNSQIIFNKINGEVKDFNEQINIKVSSNSQENILKINKLGVIQID